MKLKTFVRGQGGFSLVELMVVVGIIGILTSLAIPRFQNFQAKAKMSEAKATLGTIRTLEESYFSEKNAYLGATSYGGGGTGQCNRPQGFIDLGFEIKDCPSSRFQYSVTPGANNASYTARADTTAQNKVCSSTTQLTIDMNDAGAITMNPASGC